ncbi:hypothetical protein [Halobacteriovorax sp.]|uniref:hypothetical protein n=1 Tax=Halobacteriovorax sp. TaxID=2020862 RepID=UPI003561B76A
MKYILMLALCMSFYSKNSFANELSEEVFLEFVVQTEKGMEIDIVGLCAHSLECKDEINIKYRDILDLKITRTNPHSYYIYKSFKDTIAFCYKYDCGGEDLNGSVSITSNLPIVEFNSGYSTFKVVNGSTLDFDSRGKKVQSIDNKKRLTLIDDEIITLKTITVSGAMTNFNSYYQHAKGPLKNALKMIKRETLTFQKSMSKSDRNVDHFERFLVSLDDAMLILEDKKDYSVLDWRVQEGMRRVVSFGMIISDVLWAYEDVPSVVRNIANIRKFRDEVRTVYGWNDTLAGNVSKTTGAIFELLHYEIKQIMLLKLEVGFNNYSTYNDLSTEIKKLIVMVNANDGGDMVVAQNIHGFMNKWNDSAWQIELQNLMEAKLDLRNLVRPKLKYMLNAVMALEELIDQRKVYFEIDVLRDAQTE